MMEINDNIDIFVNQYGLKITGWNLYMDRYEKWVQITENIKKYPHLTIDVSHMDSKSIDTIVGLDNKIICRKIYEHERKKIEYVKSGRIKYLGKNTEYEKEFIKVDPDEYNSEPESE